MIRKGKDLYRRKLEKNNARDVWRGLQTITGHRKGVGRDQTSGDKDWAVELNLFFNRFDPASGKGFLHTRFTYVFPQDQISTLKQRTERSAPSSTTTITHVPSATSSHPEQTHSLTKWPHTFSQWRPRTTLHVPQTHTTHTNTLSTIRPRDQTH